jgi:small subunit ribosomal protein S11
MWSEGCLFSEECHLFRIAARTMRHHEPFSSDFHSTTPPRTAIEGASTPGSVNMSQNTALRTFRSLLRTSHRSLQPTRCLSQTSTAAAQPPPGAPKQEQTLDSLMSSIDSNFRKATPDYFSNLIPGQQPGLRNLVVSEWAEDDKHKLHIYATKHNTHITLSKPNRDALISVSCGNIGFRKAGRGTYDAAYQLAAFVMSRIQDKGLLPQIQKVELVYRGFGPGREAVTKAILSSEGKKIRGLIVKLSDSTRLKFGGVRSKKPRRLG